MPRTATAGLSAEAHDGTEAHDEAHDGGGRSSGGAGGTGWAASSSPPAVRAAASSSEYSALIDTSLPAQEANHTIVIVAAAAVATAQRQSRAAQPMRLPPVQPADHADLAANSAALKPALAVPAAAAAAAAAASSGAWGGEGHASMLASSFNLTCNLIGSGMLVETELVAQRGADAGGAQHGQRAHHGPAGQVLRHGAIVQLPEDRHQSHGTARGDRHTTGHIRQSMRKSVESPRTCC